MNRHYRILDQTIKKCWLFYLLSHVSEHTGQQKGARGEGTGGRRKPNQLPPCPNARRVYISYGCASRFGQKAEFPIHKEKFQVGISQNQTRMKNTLNYLEIRHALELINCSPHFQKPLVVTRNITRTSNPNFWKFQFQKKPTDLQLYHLSPLH